MKRTWRLAVISALSLALLSGCASTESLEEKINSGDFTAGDVLNLAKNYAKEERAWDAHRLLHFGLDTFPDDAKLMAGLEKYPMPAPELLVTENADGSKSLTVENTYGFGEETVICVSDVPCENSEDVMETAHSKSPTYSHDSYTIGEETIYLCFAEELHGQTCLSEMSSVTITIESLNLSSFAFGEFENDILSFENTYGGDVYYTLDGSDPLANGTLQGTLFDPYDDPPLPAGEFTVSARCKLPDGTTSDLIQEEFMVEPYFSSTSSLVSEDRYYEYVTTGNAPLYRSDKLGNKREVYDSRSVQTISAIDCLILPDGVESQYARPAIQATYRLRTLCIYMNGNLEVFDERDYIYMENQVETEVSNQTFNGGSMYTLGNDFIKAAYPNGEPAVFNVSGKDLPLDYDTMVLCQLLVGDDGYYAQGSSVLNEAGSTLFSVTGHNIVLDALWQKDDNKDHAKIFFHYEDNSTAHFVADAAEDWAISPNPVTNGLKILGYTENGVYYLDGGDICRKAMDYRNL